MDMSDSGDAITKRYYCYSIKLKYHVSSINYTQHTLIVKQSNPNVHHKLRGLNFSVNFATY